MRGLALPGIVILFLLAGCSDASGSGNPGGTGTSAPRNPDLGSIEGTVVDDAGLPVADVMIALLDQGATGEQQTDEAGAFAFRGLQPGEYRLAAQKLGYESVIRKVDVVASESTTARLTLVPIQVVTVFHDTRIISGLIGCVVTVLVPIEPGYTSYACGDVAEGINVNPNNRLILTWNITGGAVTHVAELDWKPQSSMSDQLRFQIAGSFNCAGPTCFVGANYQTKGGPAPVVHRFDESGIKQFGKAPQPVAGRFTGGPVPQTMPVRVILDQKFDVYLTDFFGEEPPEIWTATPPKA